MNQEPVAYINKEDGLVCAKCYKPFTKELTDEEIQDLIVSKVTDADMIRQALKKANEK